MRDADETPDKPDSNLVERATTRQSAARTGRRRQYAMATACLGAGAILAIAGGAWLGTRAITIQDELDAAAQLIPMLKANITADKPQEAKATSDKLRSHTVAASDAAGDPLWNLAASLPWIGANLGAISEVARSADDVANLGVAPLVEVYGSLDWDTLLPSSGGSNLEPLQSAAPRVSAAAHAVRVSAERLERINTDDLWPQVADPLEQARAQLGEVTGALDASANAARIAPDMLGAAGERNYLLMIQNNAETRASGGIPGALAVMTLHNGAMTLGAQSSAAEVGTMSPEISVDPEQEGIYSTRLGRFMQDVNLTPDFPTAASTAQAMWEKKTGQRVDGVVSLDPIALSYILNATGPVTITDPKLTAPTFGGLPTQLSGKNVVDTLLSDVYAKVARPDYQDLYFAGVAKEVFGALSQGRKGDSRDLIAGITRGASEGRILLWSTAVEEQQTIAGYPVSGAISGPSVAPAQFGIYFNDGTGAKMDYYVKRSVQLVKRCSTDGYELTAVRVTSTNTAPADAGSSLPPYVTGAAVYGVPAGTVRTNLIAYGPVQANVETAHVDGQKTDFAAHHHANRPVGSVTLTLAPGQSSTVEMTFGKIVQHTEPNVVVTPTVQPVKEVILPTENAVCSP